MTACCMLGPIVSNKKTSDMDQRCILIFKKLHYLVERLLLCMADEELHRQETQTLHRTTSLSWRLRPCLRFSLVAFEGEVAKRRRVWKYDTSYPSLPPSCGDTQTPLCRTKEGKKTKTPGRTFTRVQVRATRSYETIQLACILEQKNRRFGESLRWYIGNRVRGSR